MYLSLIIVLFCGYSSRVVLHRRDLDISGVITRNSTKWNELETYLDKTLCLSNRPKVEKH